MTDFKRREIVSFYDGMTGWLQNVNASLADGTDPRSGSNHYIKTANSTYTGAPSLLLCRCQQPSSCMC